MGIPELPDLQPLTTQDDRLRQVAIDDGAVREAIARGEAALAGARAAGDDARMRWLLAYLGEARRIAGDLDAAEADVREALRLSREAADARGVAGNLIRLGEVLRCRDRFVEAEAALREALTSMELGVEAIYRDFALQHLGKTLLDAGRIAEAKAVLQEALAVRERRGVPSLIASTREALARAEGR